MSKELIEDIEKDPIWIMAIKNKCPLIGMEWCEYKGETFVGEVDYFKSKKSKRLMINLYYCLTKAMNSVVIKTVMWDKNKFTFNSTAN